MLSGAVIDPSAPLSRTQLLIRVDRQIVARLGTGDFVNRRTFSQRWPDADLGFLEAIRHQELPSGFTFRIPDIYRAGETHKVELLLAKSQETIFETESNFAQASIEQAQRALATHHHLTFEGLHSLNDGRLALNGWLSAPANAENDFILTVNGAAIDHFEMTRLNGPRDGLAFSYEPDRPSWLFTAEADLSRAVPDNRGYRLTLARKSDGAEPFLEGQAFYLPADWETALADWPEPPYWNVRRTNPHLADEKAQTYAAGIHAFSGYANLWHLDHAASEHAGATLKSCERILDWGCGAGRLTRHLARTLDGEIHGADIDADNIAWARENIPGVTFSAIGLDPPLPYPDEYFDAAIGMSVYTHLSEEDQYRWLEEHRRILKPGGLLLMTILSETAMKRARLIKMVRYAREMRRRGISDSDIPPLFEEMLGDRADYYRNTWHSHDYIYARWRDYFDIAGIEPGGSLGLQDIVVGVRR